MKSNLLLWGFNPQGVIYFNFTQWFDFLNTTGLHMWSFPKIIFNYEKIDKIHSSQKAAQRTGISGSKTNLSRGV